jgi:hypothetical protein
MTDERTLAALDGSNPLAFLAALGTLRLLDARSSNELIRLRWTRRGVWLPIISGVPETEDALCTMLADAAKGKLPAEELSKLLGKNLTVDERTFENAVREAYVDAFRSDRMKADFIAGFGSEICKEERKDRIEYTDFCFITGSGHQHFLGTMVDLKQNITVEHIRNALFGDWTRNKGLSMRWDPADAAEYAFRWGDPSGEGASAVWGANVLAVHSLPLFPTQPTERGFVAAEPITDPKRLDVQSF